LRFLLDTVVVSEARKSRANNNVAQWFSTLSDDDVRVSIATLYEIRRGIALAERKDPPFAALLARWLGEMSTAYAERLIPVDARIAVRWGALSGAIGYPGADLIIAATAIEHNLVVATRNTSDFLPAGVPVLNPFEPNPAVVRPPL
jgi:toxin FitB